MITWARHLAWTISLRDFSSTRHLFCFHPRGYHCRCASIMVRFLFLWYNCINIAAKGETRNFRQCSTTDYEILLWGNLWTQFTSFIYREIKSTSWIGIKFNFLSQMIQSNYPRYCRVIIWCTVFIMFTWNSIQGFTTISNTKIYTCWTWTVIMLLMLYDKYVSSNSFQIRYGYK
jgi:hypothetical protein